MYASSKEKLKGIASSLQSMAFNRRTYLAISVAASSPYFAGLVAAFCFSVFGARLPTRMLGSYASVPARLHRASVLIFFHARCVSVRKHLAHHITRRVAICLVLNLIKFLSSRASRLLSIPLMSRFFLLCVIASARFSSQLSRSIFRDLGFARDSYRRVHVC